MATITLTNLSIALDFGAIPLINRYPGIATNISIALDYGITQPKNFYKGAIGNLSIQMDAGMAGFDYQIV